MYTRVYVHMQYCVVLCTPSAIGIEYQYNTFYFFCESIDIGYFIAIIFPPGHLNRVNVALFEAAKTATGIELESVQFA